MTNKSTTGLPTGIFSGVHDIQMDLLPGKLHRLRWKLNQKAKKEPKSRFYKLCDRILRMDVLEAALKHVSKTGKAPGINGVRAEDILAEKTGPRKCHKPTPAVVNDLNAFLRGWSGYFDHGYPAKRSGT